MKPPSSVGKGFRIAVWIRRPSKVSDVFQQPNSGIEDLRGCMQVFIKLVVSRFNEVLTVFLAEKRV